MINVVIIEDDKMQQKLYKDTIDIYNLTGDKKINATYLENDKELLSILFYQRCDCLILDLDWGDGVKENSGNQLLEKLVSAKNIPIFIVSGNLVQLDKEYPVSSILKKYKRDTDFNEILEEVVRVYKYGYSRVLGSNGVLDNAIKDIFWSNTSNQIEIWKELDDPVKDMRISRYTVTRVAEKLGLRDGKSDEHSSIEFYITPRLRDQTYSGDILKLSDKNYIVLTAACDIENGKSEYYTLGEIDFERLKELKDKMNNKETDRNKMDVIKPYVNNAKNRFHLMPPCEVYCGGILDFQSIISVAKNDIEKYEYVVSVAPNFSKDIQARFAMYYSRQGQPQLSCEEIVNIMKN